MKHISKEFVMQTGSILLKSLIISIAFSAASVLLLRFLGPIIGIFAGSASDVANIFGQLRTQQILPPFLFAFAVWFVFLDAGKRRIESPALKTVLTVACGILLFFAVLLLTSVNGILFGKVLRSLVGYVKNGLFTKL